MYYSIIHIQVGNTLWDKATILCKLLNVVQLIHAVEFYTSEPTFAYKIRAKHITRYLFEVSL